MDRIIIIGAGQAGSSAAFALRKQGFVGEIALIGEESAPPYQRPPLSKAYLLGDMVRDRLFLKPQSSYADIGIDLRLGTHVSGIDPQTKSIRTNTENLKYDSLLLTTGSSPIRLPTSIGGSLDGVHVVRTLADTDAMQPEFQDRRKLLIVGGGYIGLEAAAVAATKNLDVTLVEMSERILQRVAAPETSDMFRNLHIDHGVQIREGIGLKHLTGDDRVRQATLSNDETLDVDFVIVGIGIRPSISLAELSGLKINNGIAVDAFGQTSEPDIWAAGDCACFPRGDEYLRLESVPHAIDHAETVAANILGANMPYVAKPWFWSDQYDVKLQIAGLNSGYDRVITRPGAREGSVSFWYFAGERLLAVDAINAPREFMIARRVLEAGKTVEPAAVANPDTDLKSMI